MEFIIEDLRNVIEDHGKSMGISSDMLRIQGDIHIYNYIYNIWMVGREALLLKKTDTNPVTF